MLTRQLYKLIAIGLVLILLNLVFSLNTAQAQSQVYANKRYLIVVKVITSPALVPLVVEFDAGGNLQFVSSSLNPVVFGDVEDIRGQEIPEIVELVPTPFMQFGIQYHNVRKTTQTYRAALDTDADEHDDSTLSLRFSKDGSTLRGTFRSSGSDSIGPDAIRATIQGVETVNLLETPIPAGFTRFMPLGKESDVEISEVECIGADVCNITKRGDFVGYEFRLPPEETEQVRQRPPRRRVWTHVTLHLGSPIWLAAHLPVGPGVPAGPWIRVWQHYKRKR